MPPKTVPKLQKAPTPSPRKKVTLSDVAAHCNVSRATVSRILNNRLNGFPVSPETRTRVLEASRKLGYRANRLARAIREQRTNLIGLSTPTYLIAEQAEPTAPDSRWINYGECIAAVFSHPLFEKYDLVMHGRKEYQKENLSESDFQPDLLDGLIYMTPSDQHREFLDYARPEFPIVLVGQLDEGSDRILSVDVNNRKAAAHITHHLLSRGCRRILCVYARNFEGLTVTQDRIGAFRETMKEAGLSPTKADFIGVDYSFEGGIELIEGLSKKDLDKIDGIVVMAEFIGNGILEGLKSRGLRVPDDVQMAGFAFPEDRIGDADHRNRHYPYPCIVVPVRKLIYGATDHLLRILEGEEEYTPGFREVDFDFHLPPR